MTRKYLIDNNIWASHEKGYPPIVDFIRNAITNDEKLYTTRMIQMELMSFFEVETKPTVRENRENYLALCDKNLEIDEQTILKAAEIRRKARVAGKTPPKGPDAMIAAAAILHNLTLVSNNDKDFTWATAEFGLDYENPVTDQEEFRDFNKIYDEAKKKKEEEDKKKGLL